VIRPRMAALLSLVLVVGSLTVGPAAHAASSRVVLAQDTDQGDTSTQGDESGGGEGSGSPEAESGGSGETEGGAAEAGPPWTYQMAKISAILLVLILLITGIQYYRMVVRRQRGLA
jgi:hypothetical protein